MGGNTDANDRQPVDVNGVEGRKNLRLQRLSQVSDLKRANDSLDIVVQRESENLGFSLDPHNEAVCNLLRYNTVKRLNALGMCLPIRYPNEDEAVLKGTEISYTACDLWKFLK